MTDRGPLYDALVALVSDERVTWLPAPAPLLPIGHHQLVPAFHLGPRGRPYRQL